MNEQLISEVFAKHLGVTIDSEGISSVSGGDMNAAYKVQCELGDFFLKTNSAPRYPGMLAKEAKSLSLMGENGVPVPRVIASGEMGGGQYLILEWIQEGLEGSWYRLGRDLAAMHQVRSDRCGFYSDNWIGSLPQSNHWETDWRKFFVEQRVSSMRSQSELTHQGELNGLLNMFEEAIVGCSYQPEIGLLHGDLWSGNVMLTNSGGYFFDPACYYGPREIDLAMTTLFGNFDGDFYEGYHKSYPIRQGFEDRIWWWNVYPLLVHVTLFGARYVPQLENCLKNALKTL